MRLSSNFSITSAKISFALFLTCSLGTLFSAPESRGNENDFSEKLPYEITSKILTLLDPHSYQKTSYLSRYSRQVASDPYNQYRVLTRYLKSQTTLAKDVAEISQNFSSVDWSEISPGIVTQIKCLDLPDNQMARVLSQTMESLDSEFGKLFPEEYPSFLILFSDFSIPNKICIHRLNPALEFPVLFLKELETLVGKVISKDLLPDWKISHGKLILSALSHNQESFDSVLTTHALLNYILKKHRTSFPILRQLKSETISINEIQVQGPHQAVELIVMLLAWEVSELEALWQDYQQDKHRKAGVTPPKLRLLNACS